MPQSYKTQIKIQSYPLGSLIGLQELCFKGDFNLYIMGYLSNRPQVSVVYNLINHLGCW